MAWEYITNVLAIAEQDINDSNLADSSLHTVLNDWGKEGWEVVSVVPVLTRVYAGFEYTSKVMVVLKRSYSPK
ncbi:MULTISPECIES: DUF4177 domain-containing protein [Calothrix]|uniref:DUF4177 domain-containing protein n=2 Tax=Calothrix TaxID=1186 RepID=A0ABR8AJK4_9CYAN|nr:MULTISPECIES: DUF4177 domain-containing protein [Calothrix]MBD2199969.1 DUF4177 domain-containing protein [Calothrix parietina FACHB-288]MBD2228864.1 DUF4177 domain-containing protein [Calothrix anomala FACHB-343]